MENSVSATTSFSLRFPPNPIPKISQVFSFRPHSIESPTRTHHREVPKFTTKKQRNKEKVKPFAEEDAFPCSLPLHNKNPSSIYKDIKNFARQNKLKEALTILDYMDQQGIPVNHTTFSSLIAACIRTKSLSQGREVHTHIRINGLENNNFLRTKLVHMYTSCGSLEEARKVFDGLPCENVYPWNALLRGTVISGKRQYGEVLNTYSEMRALGIELNVYSFSCVIKSFAGASALFQGLKTHALLIKNGFVDDSILRTSLIDMYFKCGKVKLACRMFEEILERDVVCWTALMSGYASSGKLEQALRSTIWMQQQGFRPDVVTVGTVLPICAQLRALEQGKQIHAYASKHWFLPNVSITSSLMVMYSKCGVIEYSVRLFDTM